ncbi:glucosamine-6-phosphate deaminase [Actinomycetaceae bacterium MB13-C1-2]|nr:glucosamine-6-phosphate deaminase [Actinomycetaceae bacterium MB13-C1-2]
MRVAVLPSSKEIAPLVADMYSELLAKKPDAVLGLATGSSPVPIYDELIRRHEAGKISFAEARAFLLDEYVGLPADHPEGYRNFIERVFAGRVNFAPNAVIGPDGQAEDVEAAAVEYQKQMETAGWVDLQILGIGTDGHIAFNEPGGSLTSPVHTQVLTRQTREDNARFFGGDINKVPSLALTQGLETIGHAKKIVLVAEGKQKAEAVAQMVEGGVSALWPATVLQFHNDVTIMVDEQAASGLRLIDHYRAVWDAQ